MPINAKNRYRLAIAQKVRQLRTERRWTQRELARLLGLSQPRLSQIEQGQGSFTAEQLLLLLKNFNVSLNYFIPSKGVEEGRLRNALARLGAAHLQESADVLPTEKLEEVLDVLREAIASAESPRLITATAPVLVGHAKGLNLGKLLAQLDEVGFGHRLGWTVENTAKAIHQEVGQPLPKEWELRYHQAAVILDNFLSRHAAKAPETEDILDADILSQKTLDQVRQGRSAVSKRWGIITSIQTEDFIQALRAARE